MEEEEEEEEEEEVEEEDEEEEVEEGEEEEEEEEERGGREEAAEEEEGGVKNMIDFHLWNPCIHGVFKFSNLKVEIPQFELGFSFKFWVFMNVGSID